MNPAFLKLARRRGIIQDQISKLVKECTAAFGLSAVRAIVIEDVPRSVSEIPQEDIQEYINDLQQEEERLRLEMLKFEFVRKEDVQQPTQPSSNRVLQAQAGEKEGRRRRRRKR